MFVIVTVIIIFSRRLPDSDDLQKFKRRESDASRAIARIGYPSDSRPNNSVNAVKFVLLNKHKVHLR